MYRTDISNVIRELIPDFTYDTPDDQTAYWINCGMCGDFADAVCDRVLGAEPIWDDQLAEDGFGGHCVIEYCGRYYDSECPDGVDDWLAIPYFVRYANQLPA